MSITKLPIRSVGTQDHMRRKTPVPLAVSLLATALVLLFVVHYFRIIIGLAFVGGLVFLIFKLLSLNSTSYARQTAWHKAAVIISNHAHSLARKRAQLVTQDPYGGWIFDRWWKEVEYFMNRYILPALTVQEQQILNEQRSQLFSLIDERTYSLLQTEPVFRVSGKMTPYEFEAFCAEQLRFAGWNAQVTMASRDQGVDVIGEKAGKRIVLQCKLYSGPVGNGAVQEIAAARAHERADYAAVVTNSRYTAPAEQLASTNGILLLHYRDLSKLDELLTAAAVSAVT